MRMLLSVKARIIGACVVLVLIGCLSVMKVYEDFQRLVFVYPSCPVGSECERFAKLFVSDYTESKDLAKSFLTILVAVFVASITFSEKIVDMSKAGTGPKTAMILCWVFLLIAIIACGTGVAYMVIAYGIAVYTPQIDYRFHEARAVQLFLGSGVAFGAGLAAMLLAGLSTFVGPTHAPLIKPTDEIVE